MIKQLCKAMLEYTSRKQVMKIHLRKLLIILQTKTFQGGSELDVQSVVRKVKCREVSSEDSEMQSMKEVAWNIEWADFYKTSLHYRLKEFWFTIMASLWLNTGRISAKKSIWMNCDFIITSILLQKMHYTVFKNLKNVYIGYSVVWHHLPISCGFQFFFQEGCTFYVVRFL